MRKLIYVVGDKETTSYAEARKLQPNGQLETRLEQIVETYEVKLASGRIATGIVY